MKELYNPIRDTFPKGTFQKQNRSNVFSYLSFVQETESLPSCSWPRLRIARWCLTGAPNQAHQNLVIATMFCHPSCPSPSKVDTISCIMPTGAGPRKLPDTIGLSEVKENAWTPVCCSKATQPIKLGILSLSQVTLKTALLICTHSPLFTLIHRWVCGVGNQFKRQTDTTLFFESLLSLIMTSLFLASLCVYFPLPVIHYYTHSRQTFTFWPLWVTWRTGKVWLLCSWGLSPCTTKTVHHIVLEG